jgi:GNAT superfamily N-acetyltransferase
LTDALGPMRANMRAFYRLIGERAPGARVFERDGLIAAIVPSCPGQSVLNGVVYDGLEVLRSARGELEEGYARAGVRAWRVWVQESDRAAGELLRLAGHEMVAAPRAMVLELGEVSGPEVQPPDGVEFERSRDGATVAALNEQAYGLPEGEFAPTLAGFADDPVSVYLAYERGEPASCVAVVDEGGDCGVYCVATRPASRGRGLASALMRRVLVDARERGCNTSSLQSSDLGFPVYQRLGYRDFGPIAVWQLGR